MVDVPGERAVGVGRDARNIATGDYVQQIEQAVVLPAEAFMPVGELAKRVVKLPVPTRVFVGRERELGLLDELSGVVCVHGLGGIGKSTLVAKWARERAGEDRNPVWWITADSPAAIDAGLTGLGIAMQPELAAVLPQQALRERALQWLGTHDGWLIVLDNVVDPADVEPLLERARGCGRFVITSRRGTGWHGTATTVDLDVLDAGHAAELFERICPGGGPDVPELVAELGHLPLAVEQAAAFCRETGTSAGRYLELLGDYPADMYAATAEGGDPERTVARVWRVTLDRLEEGDQTAVVLLYVLAWYAPDGIPRSLLEQGARQPLAVTRGLGRLVAHSMVSTEGGTLSVHRLVQAVTRTPDGREAGNGEFIRAARDQAIHSLLCALPEDPADAVSARPVWRSLIPHVEALADHVPPEEDTELLAAVMHRAGTLLMGQLDVHRAQRFLVRVHATCVRRLGPEHPSTLAVAGDLAHAHSWAGDYSASITLLERVREDGGRILAEDRPQLARLLGALGSAYYRTGRLDTAMRLHRQSLEMLVEHAGRDDERTFRAHGDLLSDLLAAGLGEMALPLLRQYAEEAERRYGEGHPVTFTARTNLAWAHQECGEPERAVDLLRGCLADGERLLESRHPYIWTVLNNLGAAYRAAGRPAEAVEAYEQALDGLRRAYGETHPETLKVRDNLESARQSLQPPE
ncbi:tetratricopeptide repeat protein [Streptomyces sp. NPDC057257]|uniref:tetratricopeptide repeat protein n=1 Tax=Streptomyces sp. NPDC057257 TaxID=3346071 RepID=UPI00362871F4